MAVQRKEEAQRIVDTYGDAVYKFALSLTRHKDVADDVFQEVFLRYMKKSPVFENEKHARAWFYVVTKNCCRSHFMSAFIRRSAPLDQDIPFLKEPDYALYQYVLKLPMKYRTVIHLYYYEGYSTKEIASLLKKKEATVRTQLKRARDLLKQVMEGSDSLENL